MSPGIIPATVPIDLAGQRPDAAALAKSVSANLAEPRIGIAPLSPADASLVASTAWLHDQPAGHLISWSSPQPLH